MSEHPQLQPGGGGGGSPPAQTHPHQAICPTADTAARRAADTINALPSASSQEWGGAIARRGANQFAISKGEISSENQGGKSLIHFSAQDQNSLVGMVHNHPANATTAATGRYPSDGDWAGMEMLFQNVPAIDKSVFAIYIVDTVGIIRRFPYSQKSQFPNDSQVGARENGQGLPPAIGQATGCSE